MSKSPWVKWFPGDFLNGVVELEPNELAAYVIVLNLIYDQGGPIKADIERLAKRCRMRPTSFRKAIDELVEAGKLTLEGGLLSNRRAEKLIETREKVSEKSAESSNRRWKNQGGNSNKNNAPGDADAMPTQCEGNAMPEARSQKPDRIEANASVVSADFEEAWRAYPHTKGRSSKAKTLTAWRKLPFLEKAAMPTACERYAAEGREPCADCGAPAMDRWLRDGRHMDWLPEKPTELSPFSGSGDGPGDEWRSRCRSWAKSQFWNTDDWGPKPGRDGCRCPAEILAEFSTGPGSKAA